MASAVDIYRFSRLESENDIKNFDCGDQELNDFFIYKSLLFTQNLLANTLILNDTDNTVAFCSLLNDKISDIETDKNLWRKIKKDIPHRKHFRNYPAIKIGRLAVSIIYQGSGIGSEFLSTIKQLIINNNPLSAARFMTVDAYPEAIQFYIKNGFRPLLNEYRSRTMPMYFDLITLI